MNEDLEQAIIEQLKRAIDEVPAMIRPAVIEAMILILQSMLPEARQAASEAIIEHLLDNEPKTPKTPGSLLN